MKRWGIRIFVLLLFGAIVNVAVAWGCARFVPLTWFAQRGSMLLSGGRVPCYINTWTKPGHVGLEGFPVNSPAEFFEGMSDWLEGDQVSAAVLQHSHSLPFGWPGALRHAGDDLPDRHSFKVDLCGWPFPAMQRRTSSDFANELKQMHQGLYSGDHISNMMLLVYSRDFVGPNDDWKLPSQPVWPGFALNTLGYAIAVAALALVIRLMRSALRCLMPRRRAFVIVTALLLGAISTVGMAWASAVWNPASPDRYSDADVLWGGKVAERARSNAGYVDWNVMRIDSATSVHCRSEWRDGDFEIGSFSGIVPMEPAEPLVPYWGSMLQPKPGTGGRRHETIVHAHGWPLCALWWGHLDRPPNATNPDRSIRATYGVPLPPTVQVTSWSRQTLERALPLAPIWFGLGVDSLAFGALWLLLLCMVVHAGAGRRYRRSQRGLCPKCAYDLRGTLDSAACPECGATR